MKYTNKELQEIYNERYAKSEAKENFRETRIYSKLKNILLPGWFIHSEEVVNLDLGCGEGHKTIGFSSGFKKVVAVDISDKAIEKCNKLYELGSIEFLAKDAMFVNGKFTLITAFGFSLFNTADNLKFIEILHHFHSKNLDLKGKAFIVIGSFTDFSGAGEDSWYLHTKQDLEFLRTKIETRYKAKVRIVFPHRKWDNYFGFGMYNLFSELVKLFFKRKKTFFIVIEHG